MGRSSKGPVPRRGTNRKFDDYCDVMMNDLDAEETDFSEMRRWVSFVQWSAGAKSDRAAWATWGVGPPSRSNTAGPSRQAEEDEELARSALPPDTPVLRSS